MLNFKEILRLNFIFENKTAKVFQGGANLCPHFYESSNFDFFIAKNMNIEGQFRHKTC